jgi:hypothetical protein
MSAVQCFSRSDAKQLVRHCLEQGAVIFSLHFREELAQEGLEIIDAQRILKHGHIYKEPEQDIKTGEWKYRIEGPTIDSRELRIVFCFKAIDMCLLITVF